MVTARVWQAIALAGLALGATSAAAQVTGLPVYNAGVPRGVGLSADLGLPNDDAGKGVGYGVTGSAGTGRFGVTGSVAVYNPDGPPGGEVSLGGTVNYKVFGGPLIPLAVTVQAGAGYAKVDGEPVISITQLHSPIGAGMALRIPAPAPGEEITQLNFPIGVGVALTIPNPALAIKPWLAPRVHIARTKLVTNGIGGEVEETSTDTEFAISGGVELNFLSGFGLHAAYDLITGGPVNPGVFGIGAHYVFRVPGL